VTSSARPTPDDALSALGWRPDLAEALAQHPSGAAPARVARADRGGVELLSAEGPLRALLGPGLHRSPPTTGDWVVVRLRADGRSVCEAVLPRRTAVVRGASDRTSTGQVLAANVDLVVVVEHLEPEPDLGRVERLLTLAWGSGAVPLVVLTKADLVSDAPWLARDVAAASPGAEVLVVSATTGQGMADLRARVRPGQTLVLLGPSGAGKSTLTNRLAGHEIMAVSHLRADGRGRHTTTHRELVPLPSGGVVLDTPGLRGISLVADDDSIAAAFSDVEELSAGCRFDDCAHTVEPGCAVLAAVTEGDLDERRLASWRKLGREARWQAARQDARLRAEAAAVWKRRHREMRRGYREGLWRR
jgi:ribosome biogenesis GTPase / thiamine phosphate phosphatase